MKKTQYEKNFSFFCIKTGQMIKTQDIFSPPNTQI